MIWEVLEIFKKVGKPLSSATKVGELVSLYVRKQEVARGIILEQPEIGRASCRERVSPRV